MQKLIVECPINSLSFGQVSVNILRELYKRNVEVVLFPIGNFHPVESFAAFDKLSQGFKTWITDAMNKRLTVIKRDMPSLKIWHINGSHQKITDNQYLLTFYECDSPTEEEINIINLQNHVFFPTQYNIDVFGGAGIDTGKMTRTPMGFDTDYSVLENQKTSDKIEFALIGKWEKRKNTSAIINAWVKKYGNDKRYCLNMAVTNPFLSQDYHNQLLSQALEGKSYDNLNFIQYMKVNSSVNNLMNFIDVDLGGMSSAEGWNLPSFNMTSLGKWSAVLNATAHKDWATFSNSILVEPSGMQPIYDGAFFAPKMAFNQGNSYTFEEEELITAMEKLVIKAKTPNTEGVKLQEEFTWKKTVDTMLAKIFA